MAREAIALKRSAPVVDLPLKANTNRVSSISARSPVAILVTVSRCATLAYLKNVIFAGQTRRKIYTGMLILKKPQMEKASTADIDAESC